MAPELYTGGQYDGPKVDVFAMGAMLFLIRFGCFGFLKANDKHYRNLILNPTQAMVSKGIQHEEHLLDLMIGMLNPDVN